MDQPIHAIPYRIPGESSQKIIRTLPPLQTHVAGHSLLRHSDEFFGGGHYVDEAKFSIWADNIADGCGNHREAGSQILGSLRGTNKARRVIECKGHDAR